MARGIKAYIAVEPGGMPALGGIRARMARSLLGVRCYKDEWSGETQWTLFGSLEWTDNRIRSAGIDPKSWQIVDRKRAGWAWHQLRTGTQKYSMKRQVILMASEEEAPDANIPLIFTLERKGRSATKGNKDIQVIRDEVITDRAKEYLREKGIK